MTDNITNPSWVEIDGNVCVPDTVEGDPTTPEDLEAHYEALQLEELSRNWQIAQIREHAEFGLRNTLVGEAGKLAARSRATEGFAALLAKEGRDSMPAEGRAATDHAKAVQTLHEACGACALKRFCDFKADGVIQAIGLGTIIDTDTKRQRDRLRQRVKNEENNHFCETNLKPERLDEDRA